MREKIETPDFSKKNQAYAYLVSHTYCLLILSIVVRWLASSFSTAFILASACCRRASLALISGEFGLTAFSFANLVLAAFSLARITFILECPVRMAC